MELTHIKITTGPMATIMSLGYVVATAVALYLEKILGWLQLSTLSMGVLSLLMTVDFVCGIWQARRLKVIITSKAAKEGFYIKVVSLIAILTLCLVLKATGIPTMSLVNVLIVVGCLIEAYSIFGHLQSIVTRKEVTEQDAITYVLVAGRKKLWKWIKYLTKKGDPESGDI